MAATAAISQQNGEFGACYGRGCNMADAAREIKCRIVSR